MWEDSHISYAVFGAVLSWSFPPLAVAAKNVMTSVPHYLVIETGFTVVQWIMVGPPTAFAFSRAPTEGNYHCVGSPAGGRDICQKRIVNR
jgi:hypothetical protein